MDRQEAIKIVKSNLPEGRQMLSEALELLIPELAESEDERVRKQLIAVVELYYGETDEQEKKDCLSWLEKQGEQSTKFTDYKDAVMDIVRHYVIPDEIDDELRRIGKGEQKPCMIQ